MSETLQTTPAGRRTQEALELLRHARTAHLEPNAGLRPVSHDIHGALAAIDRAIELLERCL